MENTLLLALLFGALWGTIWGISDGTFQKKGILVGSGPDDFFKGLLRNFLSCMLGYIPALLIFGISPLVGTGLLLVFVVALPLKWALERHFKK